MHDCAHTCTWGEKGVNLQKVCRSHSLIDSKLRVLVHTETILSTQSNEIVYDQILFGAFLMGTTDVQLLFHDSALGSVYVI